MQGGGSLRNLSRGSEAEGDKREHSPPTKVLTLPQSKVRSDDHQEPAIFNANQSSRGHRPCATLGTSRGPETHLECL